MIAEISTIVARGMGVRRAGRWLLRPAAFGIADGVTGLAGPPGVGKTTLLATFATLRRPQSGALEVLGHDTGTSWGLRALRARIGYLPAGLDWAAHLCVRDLVAYAAYYKAMPRAAVNSILIRLDLTEFATVKLGLLPPEVRLRAGLAATCVHDPELVLLDEPLAGLDPATAGALTPILAALAPAVLVTAPTPADLTCWCDRVMTLARGRLTGLPPAPAHPRPAETTPARPRHASARPRTEAGDDGGTGPDRPERGHARASTAARTADAGRYRAHEDGWSPARSAAGG